VVAELVFVRNEFEEMWRSEDQSDAWWTTSSSSGWWTRYGSSTEGRWTKSPRRGYGSWTDSLKVGGCYYTKGSRSRTTAEMRRQKYFVEAQAGAAEAEQRSTNNGEVHKERRVARHRALRSALETQVFVCADEWLSVFTDCVGRLGNEQEAELLEAEKSLLADNELEQLTCESDVAEDTMSAMVKLAKDPLKLHDIDQPTAEWRDELRPATF